jgi:hypothetical protein
MSDIITDEEPDDIGEQLLLEEFMEAEEAYEKLMRERRIAYEPEEETTELERDIYEHDLGAAISYVVYYSSPSEGLKA